VYAPETREVDKYVISYFAGANRETRPYRYRSIISLYNSTGLFGKLFFHDSPDSLPDTDQLDGERILRSHFLKHDFQNILDILRNESPVFFHQHPAWPTMGFISTEKEPVGEGEVQTPGEARQE